MKNTIVLSTYKVNNYVNILQKIKHIPNYDYFFNYAIKIKMLNKDYQVIRNINNCKYYLLEYLIDYKKMNNDMIISPSVFCYHIYIALTKLLDVNICYFFHKKSVIKNNTLPYLNDFSDSLNLDLFKHHNEKYQ